MLTPADADETRGVWAGQRCCMRFGRNLGRSCANCLKRRAKLGFGECWCGKSSRAGEVAAWLSR